MNNSRKKLTPLLLILSLFLSACSSPRESSVVMLTNEMATGSGTGFYIKAASGKTHVVTNRHVCDGGATYLEGPFRRVKLNIIEISETTDLCLLEAVATTAQPLQLGAEPKQHDEVSVVGYGFGLGETLTKGHWVGYLPGQVLYVFGPGYATPSILPGNSGSPLLNKKGQVIGVVFASSPAIDFRSLVVPLSQLRAFLALY